MVNLNDDILMSHGGVQPNFLGSIMEPDDTQKHNETTIPLNMFHISPYTCINDVSKFF